MAKKNRKKSSRAKRGQGAPVRTSRPTAPPPAEVDREGNAASGGTLSLSLGLSKGRERGQNREDIGGAADAALPLLHRLAIAYLMLPVFVWLVGWFEWWFWLPTTVLLGAGLRPALAGSLPASGVPSRSPAEGFRRLRTPRPATLVIVLLALGWTMLSAAGGVFDGNNSDWLDHRTLLLDMSRFPWPSYLPDDLAAYLSGTSAPPALMRHYLGWYIVPGLVGRLSGPAALNWAVPLWTWLGVALILLLFVEGRRGRGAILAAGIFVFFSGMDLLRVMLVEGGEWLDFGIDHKGWPGIGVGLRHIEFFGLWDVRNQSTAHMSAFLWTPKHFICAGLYALLLLHLCRQPRFLAVSGVVLAASPFWSAFVAMGLVPLLAAVVWDNGPRPFLRWPNLCLAAPLAGLIALYLTAGSLDFPAGWLWELYDWSLLTKWAPVFYLSEFLTPALLVLMLRPALGREPFFLVSLATLLLLPWYSFSEFNDLSMRGGMPALLVVCHACVDVLVGRGAADGGGYAPAGRGRFRRVASGCLIAVLAVGALNPLLVELARATRDDVPFRYELSGFTTFGLPPLVWQRENLAPEVPALLRRLLCDPGGPSAGGTPAPAEPVVRGPFDVYVKDRQIIHVKERCRPDVAETIRVEFDPLDPDTNAETGRLFETRRVGAGCGAIVGLPGYAVAAVRTGQLAQDGGDWIVELRLDAAGRVTEVRR